MTFRVGQKVVCIETWVRRNGVGDEIGPVAGEIYTIRDIGFLNPAAPDVVAVLLAEIRNAVHDYVDGRGETCFAAHRFRPVVERKTDISIFTQMLNPSNVTA